MHDLVIRNGTIVDGTGRERFSGDVAIDGSRISAVGKVDGKGSREIDASDRIITPGFVDIHTHYDGQATWDSELAPSSWHGVTSVVFGNCGVGFAPAEPDKHDFLIELMEGVEDIPGAALAEGLPWNWRSFPEFMDALDSRPHAIDMGAQLPHAPLRAFVMGERGANHEEDPTSEEIGQMGRLAEQALKAGAIGFASSRTLNHRSRSGQKIGSLSAKTEELLGVGEALRRTNLGVFQFTSDFLDLDYEFALLRRLAEECGRPLSVSLAQADRAPERWREILDRIEEASAEGVDIKAQVAVRAIGLLLGLEGSINPFVTTEPYKAIAALPLPERVARMREPEVREAIIEEFSRRSARLPLVPVMATPDKIFRLGDPPDYEPVPEASIANEARRLGVEPVDYMYDLLLEHDGKELLYCPFANYAEFNLDVARQMALSERTLFGLSDGGAHVGIICDASFPTWNISHWCRDRKRGDQLPLEFVVQQQTRDTARHVGWHDRGVIAPGYKADLNVIDLDRLQVRRPHIVHDLPAGGRRLLQEADGYDYTICSGQVTFEQGKATGALPGRLVRGAQPAPAA
jgi:N-acyl-D-aspartate/D-glutamate deacylase